MAYYVPQFKKVGGTRRAGLKPMQPMQLHWAPPHGVWLDGSFLPDTLCAWEFIRNAI